jgi:tripartite-type tricarboxylate transporter receptor subunit TctC
MRWFPQLGRVRIKEMFMASNAAVFFNSRFNTRRAMSMTALAMMLGLGMHAAVHAAQDWPSQPIRMIVGYPPGGGTDTVARVLALRMGQVLNQSVVVENRGGASGTIAAQQVVRAAPDGYTIAFATASPLTGAPLTIKGLTYDPMKDLIPVTRIGGGPFIMVANPSFPPNNMRELVDYAKAHPGVVNYASPGVMTANYFFSEQLNMDAGIQTVHVPYKGSAALLNDVMAGQVQYTLDTPGTTLPLIKNGKLKPLAVFSEERLQRAPDIPTAKESGFPEMVGGSWYGLLVPAGTPKPIIDALYKATKVALEDPEVQRTLADRDVIIEGSTPEAFSEYLNKEYARWKSVTQRLGIEPQ